MNITCHREGYPYVIGFALLTLVLFWWFGDWAGFVGVVLTAWSVYFFRDPVRAIPDTPQVLVSPADGVVCMVTRAAPPSDLKMGDDALPRISVFMDVFDCHVNRAPVAGHIKTMAYRPGKFLNASLDKASEENERHAYHIRTEAGQDIVVVQIAGLVARRIVPFVTEGQSLARGERLGMIRFGSRVDVYLQDGMVPGVAVGQRCIAGETILCDQRISDAVAPGATQI